MALLFIAGAMVAQAFESDQSVRKAILGQYEALSKAFAKKDIKFLDSYLAKDYVAIRDNGAKMNRTQAINGFKLLMGSSKDMKWKRNIKSLTQKGSQAILKVESNIVGKVLEADKSIHSIKIHSITRDTWTKYKNAWMINQSKTITQEMYVDGKKQ
jgi:hypothetical protein